MAIQEYGSAIIPAFFTLSSLGILRPYFVEGFIIFSFIIFIATFLLSKFFVSIKLSGYYNLLLVSVSVIFALMYLQTQTIISVLTGIIILAFAIFSVYFSTIDAVATA